MLRIKILDIKVNELGYTAWDGIHPFSEHIFERKWNTVTKTVKVTDGVVHWSEDVKIPIAPMIGVVATAPALGAPLTTDLGPFGGNMDAQEVTVGNTLYLPVFVEGALLHVGDVHAVQGDGEICFSGGIEIGSLCTLQVEVVPKPERMLFPRIESDDWIASVGIDKPMDEACRIAIRELVDWMTDEYAFTQEEAILLLGQVMSARCVQIVDPKYTYLAKIDKKYLKPSYNAKCYPSHARGS